MTELAKNINPEFPELSSFSKEGDIWLLVNFASINRKENSFARELKFIKTKKPYYDRSNWDVSSLKKIHITEPRTAHYYNFDVLNSDGYIIHRYYYPYSKFISTRFAILSNTDKNAKTCPTDFFEGTILDGLIDNEKYFVYQSNYPDKVLKHSPVLYIPVSVIYQYFYYKSVSLAESIIGNQINDKNLLKRDYNKNEVEFEDSEFLHDDALSLCKYWFTDENYSGFYKLQLALRKFYATVYSQDIDKRKIDCEIFYELPFSFPIDVQCKGQFLDDEKTKFLVHGFENKMTIKPRPTSNVLYKKYDTKMIPMSDKRSSKNDGDVKFAPQVKNVVNTVVKNDTLNLSDNQNVNNTVTPITIPILDSPFFFESNGIKIAPPAKNKQNWSSGVVVKDLDKITNYDNDSSSTSGAVGVNGVKMESKNALPFHFNQVVNELIRKEYDPKSLSIFKNHQFSQIELDDEDIANNLKFLENLFVISITKAQIEYILIYAGSRRIGVFKNFGTFYSRNEDYQLKEILKVVLKQYKWDWSSIACDNKIPDTNSDEKVKIATFLLKTYNIEILKPINHSLLDTLNKGGAIEKSKYEKVVSRIISRLC